jgi:diaminohydroxyphosphoribosylaminopyrimidine deaminase/5-amino-6-(5-phosphoribosylamino)uracil reductase
MEQALSLARLAIGQVSPNPAVGAVIVKDEVIIGQGYTQKPGGHHAEIMALEQAGEHARGGTLYVTLEPCCHYGRTPPCSQAIISAGVAEVHMAMLDPNPVVSGKGRAELEGAGIKTSVGQRQSEAASLIEAYIKFITTGLPFINAKFAMSLDGKIATRQGESRWISGIESRSYIHRLRAQSDTIMAGANTIISDDPRLTARCCGGRGGTFTKQPLRVIVDGMGRTPLTARVFSEPGQTLLVIARKTGQKEKEAFERVGAELMELPAEEGVIDLKELLRLLGKRQISSILVEGGSGLLGSLFDQGLVDRVTAFIAPIIIGGESATPAVGGRGVARIADALKLENITREVFGSDIMISGYPRRQTCSPA